MADVIEPATTGRAKCRGCGRSIARGDLRFGEGAPNAYGEGETHLFYHLVCAACRRPERFPAALEAQALQIPDRAWLLAAAAEGLAHPRLPRLARVERAPSARARCRSCSAAIDKGTLRFVLEWYEEGRWSPSGYLHVECSEAYLGTADLVDRAARLTPELAADDRAALAAALAHQRPAPPSGSAESTPGLAKAGTGSPSADDSASEDDAEGAQRSSGE
jgi:hypothetical protein